MLIGIQIAGLIFGIVMLYLTQLYYRRGELRGMDFAVWCLVWVAFLYAVLFPQMLNVVIETLGVISAMDLFTIVSFMFSFAVIFHLYKTTRKLQSKMEKLVTELAQRQLKK